MVAFLRDRLYINFPGIRNILISLGVTQKRDIFLAQTPPHLIAKQKEVARLLREMAVFIEKSGSEFLVVLIPLREQVCCQEEINKFEGFRVSKPNEDLHKILEGADIQYIDLLPHFLDAYRRFPERRLYYDNDPHWTALGHELAAKILADTIQ